MSKYRDYIESKLITNRDGTNVKCGHCKKGTHSYITLWGSIYCKDCCLSMDIDEFRGNAHAEFMWEMDCYECGVEIRVGYIINGIPICPYCLKDEIVEDDDDYDYDCEF